MHFNIGLTEQIVNKLTAAINYEMNFSSQKYKVYNSLVN